MSRTSLWAFYFALINTGINLVLEAFVPDSIHSELHFYLGIAMVVVAVTHFMAREK